LIGDAWIGGGQTASAFEFKIAENQMIVTGAIETTDA
jgi:hypothetical protein